MLSKSVLFAGILSISFAGTILSVHGAGHPGRTIDIVVTVTDSPGALPALEICELPDNRKVALTSMWDDGSSGDPRMAETLDAYDWKGTFAWHIRAGAMAHVDEITSHGIEIASHTTTHPHMIALSKDRMFWEYMASKVFLGTLTQSPVTSYGDAFLQRDSLSDTEFYETDYLIGRGGSSSSSYSVLNYGNRHKQPSMQLFGSSTGPYRSRLDSLHAGSTSGVVQDMWGHVREPEFTEEHWTQFEQLLSDYGGRADTWHATWGELASYMFMLHEASLGTAQIGANAMTYRLTVGGVPRNVIDIPLTMRVEGAPAELAKVTSVTVDGAPVATTIAGGALLFDVEPFAQSLRPTSITSEILDSGHKQVQDAFIHLGNASTTVTETFVTSSGSAIILNSGGDPGRETIQCAVDTGDPAFTGFGWGGFSGSATNHAILFNSETGGAMKFQNNANSNGSYVYTIFDSKWAFVDGPKPARRYSGAADKSVGLNDGAGHTGRIVSTFINPAGGQAYGYLLRDANDQWFKSPEQIVPVGTPGGYATFSYTDFAPASWSRIAPRPEANLNLLDSWDDPGGSASQALGSGAATTPDFTSVTGGGIYVGTSNPPNTSNFKISEINWVEPIVPEMPDVDASWAWTTQGDGYDIEVTVTNNTPGTVESFGFDFLTSSVWTVGNQIAVPATLAPRASFNNTYSLTPVAGQNVGGWSAFVGRVDYVAQGEPKTHFLYRDEELAITPSVARLNLPPNCMIFGPIVGGTSSLASVLAEVDGNWIEYEYDPSFRKDFLNLWNVYFPSGNTLVRGVHVIKTVIDSDTGDDAVLKLGNYKLNGIKFWLNGAPVTNSSGYQLPLNAGTNDLVGVFDVDSGTLSYKLVGMFMRFYESDGSTPLTGVTFYPQEIDSAARAWKEY